MTQTIQVRWQKRRYATAAVAASTNEVLLAGETARELDTGREKTGDGTTHYNDLNYSNAGPNKITGLADGSVMAWDASLGLFVPKAIAEVPVGGTAGQVLTKVSGNDGDVDWENASAGSGIPAGGTTGQILTKASDTDGDADWEDAASGSATPITIVQSVTTAIASGAATYTLPNTPKPGNLLLFLATRWTTSVATGAGWTLLLNITGATNDIGIIFARYVLRGDGTTFTPCSTSTAWCGVLVEIEGAPTLDRVLITGGTKDVNGASIAIADTTRTSQNTVIGLFTAQNRAVSSDVLNGATSLGSSSVSTGSGSPRFCRAFSSVIASQGLVDISDTFSASGINSNSSIYAILGARGD